MRKSFGSKFTINSFHCGSNSFVALRVEGSFFSSSKEFTLFSSLLFSFPALLSQTKQNQQVSDLLNNAHQTLKVFLLHDGDQNKRLDGFQIFTCVFSWTYLIMKEY